MTAEPTGHESTIAELVDYARAHLPADQLDAYDGALRRAGRQVADAGDVTALSEVVEQGRWEELVADSEPVDGDAMLREPRP